MIYGVKWVTIGRAAELSGFGQDAIRAYIKLGHWKPGVQYKYNPVNRIVVNLEEMDKWQEQQPIVVSLRGRRRSSSNSNTTGAGEKLSA